MDGYRRSTLAFAIIGMSAGSLLPWRRSAPDASALGPIVGEWQSDTVGGVSAHSWCAWTQRHTAVVCEQEIERTGAGTSSALNVFQPDSAHGRFALHVLAPPGDAATPVPLTIRGAEWVYGGSAPSGDGRYYRTINDFSRPALYTWRQESSADGKEWTSGIHGASRRIR